VTARRRNTGDTRHPATLDGTWRAATEGSRPDWIGREDALSSNPSEFPPAAARGLTAFCLRHRLLVGAVWLALVLAGVAGALRLTPLLSSGFTLPGTDSNRVDQILATDYAASSRSPIVLIVRSDADRPLLRQAAARAAALLPGGRVERFVPLPAGGAAAFVDSNLSGGKAEAEIGPITKAVGSQVLVTGDAAVAHALAPVLARSLRIGELYLAVPAALLILLVVFGTASALLPFVFAAATIPPALGLAWIAAHFLDLNSYLENMVLMIGLGIAIDYSLLVVNRYRDEREQGRGHAEAVEETMVHAGRTIVFSGFAVAVGLALMLLLPVPFLRGFGLGGLLVPLISVACGLTLLPVLLVTFGERLEHVRLVPRSLSGYLARGERSFWALHARWVMRHAKLVAPVLAILLVAGAMPLLGIKVGPGSGATSLPPSLPAAKALTLLQQRSDSDQLDPTTVIVAAKRGTPVSTALPALATLRRLLRHDPQVVSVSRPAPDPNGRDLMIDIVGRNDSAGEQAQAFAERLRDRLIPAAHFPDSVQVIAGGGDAYSADFISRTLGLFPWLILGVLALTYLLLVRAFRSLLLPLKAIVLNLLTVAAASGLMIAAFQWGWGSWAGLVHVNEIEGWIPVFMFTLLFGLSMDYEVFLVSRMREAWERTRSNTTAVAHGLTSTGRIVTAAGLIMAVTFSGMLLGSIPTMQQLGFGLAVAILIDITLVRALLLPSAMAIAGSWNWYLPGWAHRTLRL